MTGKFVEIFLMSDGSPTDNLVALQIVRFPASGIELSGRVLSEPVQLRVVNKEFFDDSDQIEVKHPR
jgi:hypothetical protein